MEEYVKILLFVPLQPEDHFLFERAAGVQHLYATQQISILAINKPYTTYESKKQHSFSLEQLEFLIN